MEMKRLIIGDGRHGKDTVGDIICNANTKVRAISSSLFCARLFMFDLMKEAHGYKTIEECYKDRHAPGNREIWHNGIADFNKDDPARTARKLLMEYDLYIGMRSRLEITACFIAKTFDLIYWVDAGYRVPRESSSSMKLTYQYVLNHPDRKTPLIFVDNSKGGIKNIRFGIAH